MKHLHVCGTYCLEIVRSWIFVGSVGQLISAVGRWMSLWIELAARINLLAPEFGI
jgi:hypothetical protein